MIWTLFLRDAPVNGRLYQGLLQLQAWVSVNGVLKDKLVKKKMS